MSLLSAQFQGKSLMERVCVIAFDDMKIDERFCYDSKDDKVYGGASQLGATLIRGIYENWRQLVYYGFDEKLDKAKLFEIIGRVQESGADVNVVVCDLGPKNQGQTLI
jgi:hypothetical protein